MVRQSQFVHFDLYGMASRAGAPAWACVDDITREGARAPGATRHLPYPAEPTLLYGVQPLAAGTIAAERAIEALDAMGRRLRCDGVVLLAAVASYPVPRALVEAPEQMTEHHRYRAWLSDAVRWFREGFGETLLSIVEHVDEDYLHIHAYVVPDIGSDLRLQWEAIHPGRAALRTSIAMGEGKREQRKYYRKAMEGWQDNFHHAVSAKYGHARVGPRRRRLDRTEWLLMRKSERIEAERKQLFDQAYARMRADVRVEVKKELTGKAGHVLAEARLEAQMLRKEREADALLIAELLAQQEVYEKQLRELTSDGYGQCR